MLRDAVRGVVVVAAELAEETGKKVLGAAEGLLARAGVDVEAVERRIAEQFPPTPQSLQTLAGEAVTAGRAGVDLAVGVARGEVERLFEKVGDQVTKVGVVLSFLESKLREVEEEQPAAGRTEARAKGLFDAGWETEHQAPPAETSEGTAAESGAARGGAASAEGAAAPARKRASRGAGTAGNSAAAGPAGRAAESDAESERKAAAGEPPASGRGRAARKASAPGAPARAAAASTGEEAAPAKRAAAKRTVAKKAPAKAAVKKTVARKTSASGAAKKAAAKKTVVRKSAPGKSEESDG